MSVIYEKMEIMWMGIPGLFCNSYEVLEGASDSSQVIAAAWLANSETSVEGVACQHL